MKIISFLICFALCANAYADVSTSSGPTLDTQAPGYFAGLIGRSDYVVVPVYDSKSKSMGEPVVIRDRAKLDRFADILGRAAYKTTGHIFAVLAGGPITFYAKDKQRVLTLENFGRIVRLNGQDYELDAESSRAISEWLKESRANPLQRNTSTGSVSNFESPARRGCDQRSLGKNDGSPRFDCRK